MKLLTFLKDLELLREKVMCKGKETFMLILSYDKIYFWVSKIIFTISTLGQIFFLTNSGFLGSFFIPFSNNNQFPVAMQHYVGFIQSFIFDSGGKYCSQHFATVYTFFEFFNEIHPTSW